MKILFITATRIGDAVLSTGLLSHLMRQYPAAEITVVSGPLAAPLFETAPNVTQIIPLTKQRAHWHWAGLWRACASTRWDIVVDLRASLLAWSVRARRRHVHRPRGTGHRIVQLASLFGLEERPPAPCLWIPAAASARASALLPADRPILALGPTANWPGKRWPAENFAALVERLTSPHRIMAGATVVVLGGPGERATVRPVLEAVPAGRLVDLVGTVSLPVAAACLERAHLYIGNDSGLMHLAAAAGAPTLGLFGPSPEARYAPWGACTAVVRGPRTYEEIVSDPGFDARATSSLMHDLEIDRVLTAATALWQRARRDLTKSASDRAD